MTREQDDRENDALVAEKVMGWTDLYTHQDHHGTMLLGAHQGQWPAKMVPHYTTNASDDYEVLKHVRECKTDGMPIVDWSVYCYQLYIIQVERMTICCNIVSESAAWYATGDFSLAALAALNERSD